MAVGVGGTIGCLIGLSLYWYVLFGDIAWMKYGCMGIAGIRFLSTLGFIFTGASTLKMLPQMQGVSPHALSSFAQVFGTLDLLWITWLLAILWRDIQNQRTG
jgi:hypothetical protein